MRIAAVVIACLTAPLPAVAEEAAEPAHPLGCWATLSLELVRGWWKRRFGRTCTPRRKEQQTR